MEQLKKNVEALLRRLVGKWDFVLDSYYDPDLIRRSYFLQGLEEGAGDLLVFGHDMKDQSSFTARLHPVTVERREFLLFLFGVNRGSNGEHFYTTYHFNQSRWRISGVFHVWKVKDDPLLLDFDPETHPLVGRGSFMGFRRSDPKEDAQALLEAIS